jgi:WD40 repeat protein
MELVDVYTEDEKGYAKKVGGGEEQQDERKNINVVYGTSPTFYIKHKEALSKQVDCKSPVLCVQQFVPLPDKNGRIVEPIVVCGCLDGKIHVYTRDSLELLNTIDCHKDAVNSIKVFQPKGETLIILISGSKDGSCVVSIALGRRVGNLLGHTDSISSIDIFEQYERDTMIITSSHDGSVCVWSLTSRDLLRKICVDNGDGGSVLKASIFASDDVLKKLRDIPDDDPNQDIDKFELEKEIMILASYEDRCMRMWSLKNGTLVTYFNYLPQRITDFVYNIPKNWSYNEENKYDMKYERLLFLRKRKLLEKEDNHNKNKKNIMSEDAAGKYTKE